MGKEYEQHFFKEYIQMTNIHMESYSTSQSPGNANQNHNDTRIFCATQGIPPAFHNNCKWSITFKRYESICFDTCNLHNIIYQLYVNHKIS